MDGVLLAVKRLNISRGKKPRTYDVTLAKCPYTCDFACQKPRWHKGGGCGKTWTGTEIRLVSFGVNGAPGLLNTRPICLLQLPKECERAKRFLTEIVCARTSVNLAQWLLRLCACLFI